MTPGGVKRGATSPCVLLLLWMTSACWALLLLLGAARLACIMFCSE